MHKPIAWQEDVYFTPTAGVSYAYLIPERYTETGAGELNMKVVPEHVASLVVSLGARMHTQHTLASTVLEPFITAGVSSDVFSDEISSMNQFTGGGDDFQAAGHKVSLIGGNLGLGLNAHYSSRWSSHLRYDLNWQRGRLGHSASVELKMRY